MNNNEQKLEAILNLKEGEALSFNNPSWLVHSLYFITKDSFYNVMKKYAIYNEDIVDLCKLNNVSLVDTIEKLKDDYQEMMSKYQVIRVQKREKPTVEFFTYDYLKDDALESEGLRFITLEGTTFRKITTEEMDNELSAELLRRELEKELEK